MNAGHVAQQIYVCSLIMRKPVTISAGTLPDHVVGEITPFQKGAWVPDENALCFVCLHLHGLNHGNLHPHSHSSHQPLAWVVSFEGYKR